MPNNQANGVADIDGIPINDPVLRAAVAKIIKDREDAAAAQKRIDDAAAAKQNMADLTAKLPGLEAELGAKTLELIADLKEAITAIQLLIKSGTQTPTAAPNPPPKPNLPTKARPVPKVVDSARRVHTFSSAQPKPLLSFLHAIRTEIEDMYPIERESWGRAIAGTVWEAVKAKLPTEFTPDDLCRAMIDTYFVNIISRNGLPTLHVFNMQQDEHIDARANDNFFYFP
ncbi:hypothetical protein HDU98_001037 [Podochytrium sp. JEL0797]|nr:hypothetical protein HDU98_001037 [Podochytrium sp. JEL0797]